MTKQSGIGSAFYTGIYDLSGDIGSLGSIGLTRALQDVTGLDKDGTERIALRSDGEMSWTGFWNAVAGQAVPVLFDLDGGVLHTYASEAAIGGYAASLVGNRVSFASQSGQDGSLAITGQVQGSAGWPVEWGRLLTTGKQTFASAAAGTYIDRGAASASNYGLAGYLHAFSIGSGTAVVTIEDSADHAAWDPVIAFTGVSAAGTERIQTGLTENVRRYLRIDVSGTFTALVVAVSVVPYQVSQA
jgi:hypothetical protein